MLCETGRQSSIKTSKEDYPRSFYGPAEFVGRHTTQQQQQEQVQDDDINTTLGSAGYFPF